MLSTKICRLAKAETIGTIIPCNTQLFVPQRMFWGSGITVRTLEINSPG